MIGPGERVVVVHDYVTQRGGAERVTLDLLRAFPGARLVTSVWDQEGSFPEFAEFEIETLGLNKFRALRSDPRRAFPLLARAFGKHVIADADVVICSSSGWSHRVVTTAPKVVYCHNPARWLYQTEDYLAAVPGLLRRLFAAATRGLRRTDRAAAISATRYLVNSTVVADRAQAVYGMKAEVVHPARGLTTDGPQCVVEGVSPGFLLTIGRARGYKHTDAVAEAVAGMPDERLVVVGATQVDAPNVTSMHDISDAQLRWLFANAAGFVAAANEDFGLAVVEAQGFGVPSVLLRAGGYVDTGVEGVTCVFVDDIEPASIAGGIREMRHRSWDAAAVRECGERFAPSVFAGQVRGIVADVLAETADVVERGAAGHRRKPLQGGSSSMMMANHPSSLSA